MKTLKVKLLVSRSGEDGSHAPGEVIEVGEKEAISLVNNGSAEPKDKKAYESVIARIEKEKIEEAEKAAQAQAILDKETLTLELIDLYRQVARKSAQIEGVVLTDEEVEAFVEKSMKGEDPANTSENFPAGKSEDKTGTEKSKDESSTGNGTDETKE